MLKAIKKNQKWVMAIVSVGLMIAFNAVRPTSHTPGEIVEGHAGKIAIASGDVARCGAEWRLLTSTIFIKTGRTAEDRQPLMAVLGREAVTQIQNGDHAIMYALLQVEARNMGITISHDAVMDFVTNQLIIDPPSAELPRDFDRQIEQTVHNFMMVQAASRQAEAAVKVSKPVIDNAVALHEQQIVLNVVEFFRDSYLPADQGASPATAPSALGTTAPASTGPSTLPALVPTEAALKEQFEKFRNVNPDLVENHVGYQQPVRIALQYIGVSRDDVARSFDDYKPPMTELLTYYDAHPGEFTATTQPVDPILGVPLPTKATTQAFEDPAVQTKLVQRVKDQKIDAMRTTIMADIAKQLNVDYAAYRKATISAGAHLTTMPADVNEKAPLARNGQHYNSYAYLQQLAADMQTAHRVRPITGEIVTPQSEKQLEVNPVSKCLKHAKLQEIPITGIDLLTTFADGLLSDEDRRSVRANYRVSPPELFEPTPPLNDADDRSQYIARLTEEVASRPGERTDPGVEESLVRDVRNNMASDMAHNAADQFLKNAQGQKLTLQQAANAAQMHLITTGPISLDADDIPNYPLPASARRVLANAAFYSMQGLSANAHPMQLVDLPLANRTVVYEVEKLSNSIVAGETLQNELLVKYELRKGFVDGFTQHWFNYDDLVARTKYTPAQQPTPTKKPSKGETPPTPPLGT